MEIMGINEIRFSPELVFSDFEEFKKTCEMLELIGYRLNVNKNCYEL